MMNRIESNFVAQKEKLARYCRTKGIDLVILFGSHACGKAHSMSDLDLAVLPRHLAALSKLEILFDLSDIFEPLEVDLVLLSPHTNPLLLHEIFSNGTPLFEVIPGIFGEQRLRAWKLYLDTAPLRLLERQYLKRTTQRNRHVS